MPNEDGTPTYEELQAQIAEKEQEMAFLATEEGKQWYKENYLKDEKKVEEKKVEEKKEEQKVGFDINEVTAKASQAAIQAHERRQQIDGMIAKAGASVEDIAKHLHESAYPDVTPDEIKKRILEAPDVARFAVDSYTVSKEKQRIAQEQEQMWTGDVTTVASLPKDKVHPLEKELARITGLKDEDILEASDPNKEYIY